MLRPHAATVGLLAVYSLVLLWRRGHFELTSDDGMWVMLARNVVERKLLTLQGVMGSEGGPNSALGVYLGALPWAIQPSIRSVCTGVTVFVLMAHAMLLAAGRELDDAWTGFWASLLFFFAPAFFVFYNQKLWQVAYLPAFTTLTLLLALRYVKTRRWQTLAGAYLCVGLCVGLHQGAALLLPTVLFLPALLPQAARPNYRQMLACVSLLMLSMTHLLLWSWLRSLPVFLALAVVMNLPLLCVRRGPSIERWLDRAFVFGLPLAAAAGLAWNPRFAPLAVLGRLMDLLPAFNPYIATHVAGDIPLYSRWLHAGGPWLSLPAVAYLGYLVQSLRRRRGLPAAEKVLFYWNWTSVWLLALSGLAFRDHPHQWFVFLFPAPFLAIALTLLQLARSRRTPLRWAGSGLLAALLASYLAASSLYARFVAQSGGISWHMASLDVKLEVLSWIRAQGGRARVILAENPMVPWNSYGATGWTAAAWEALADAPQAPGPERFFYIHEPLGLGYDPNLLSAASRHSAEPPARFGSVLVFSNDRRIPVSGGNVEVFSGDLRAMPFLPTRR